MPFGPSENPIVRQLRQMGVQWQKIFTDTSKAIIGVWMVDNDTSNLVDGLPFLEDTEHGIVPSIFLTFDDDFSDPETYAYQLIETFLKEIARHESQAALKEGGVDIDLLEIDEIKDTRAWIKLLSDFADQIQLLSKGHFVAYLNPRQITNQNEWKQWMTNLLNFDIPGKLRFMAKEEPEFKWVEELSETLPGKIETIIPDVDLDKAMREIVEEGVASRPDDPAMQFRQAMLLTGQATAKQNMQKAELEGARAISITTEQEWPHLQIGIHFTLANGYIGIKDFDQAIKQYQKAQTVAQQHEVKEPEMAGQLKVQAIIGEAGCYLGMQDFSTGAEKYATAAPLAEKINKPHLELEAWRMTGFCYQYLKEHQKSWDYYRLAWAAGEKLAPEMRTSTTLPYVGQSLLELRPNAGVTIKQYELEDEITALLGDNWHNLIKTT